MKVELKVGPFFSDLFGPSEAGAPSAAALMSFAEDQNSTPWYTNACAPAAEYDSGGDRIGVVYESWSGDERTCRARLFSAVSTAITGSRIYQVYKSTLANDSHGVPVIKRNPADGRWWVFGGQHSNLGDMRVRVTTNANDFSAWTALTDLTALGNIGYPHPVFSPATANKLYLFLRKDEDATNNRRYGSVTIGTVTGASVAWGTLFKFADLGDDTRWYLGECVVVGNDIHMIAARANLADTHRRDVYYLILDTTDDSIKNFDKSVSVAAVVWQAAPIDRTALDASYRVVNISTDFGVIPAFEIADGKAHIVYKRDAGAVDGHMFYTQATLGVNSWSSVLAVGQAFVGSTDYTLGSDGADGLRLVYRSRSDGKILARRLTQAGVWEAEYTVAEPRPGMLLDTPNHVDKSAHFMFAHADDDETVEGNFDCFLSSGPTIISTGYRGILDSLFAGLTKPNATVIGQYSAFLDAALSAGAWKQIKGFYFLDPITSVQSHLRNWRGGNFDLTEQGTGSGFVNDTVGWIGNGSNRYLQSALVFNAEMIRTSCALGIAASGGGHVAGSTARCGCTNTSTAMLALAATAANGPATQLSSSNAVVGTGVLIDGVFFGRRVGTTITNFEAGLPVGTGVATDTAAGAVNFVIGQAKGAGFNTARIFASLIAGNLSDAHVLALYTALRALINARAPGSIA